MLSGPTRLVLAALLATTASCVTPSVPIPPPEPEKILFELDLDAGRARFSYAAAADFAGAVVYVFDRDRGTGVITVAADDGSVAPTEPFDAREGDDIVVTFDLGDQLAAVCVTLRAGPSSSAYECSL